MNDNTNNLIQLGRREPTEKGIENNWTVLNPYKTKIDKQKTILIFGGNTTDNPSFANGYAKQIESLIEKKNSTKSDILSFHYKTEVLNSTTKLMMKEYLDEMDKIYKAMFEPLILDKVGNIKEKQGIERVFKNLIFVGHCAGCEFVNSILNNFYNTLTQKYPQATADNLMKKIQYIAYAPTEFPIYDTNSLFISPSADSSLCWVKTLAHVFENSVDNEFPKGFSKELLKQKNQFRAENIIDDYLGLYRALVFKQGNSFYLIPGQMNANRQIGDHSIECITRERYLNSNTDHAQTAQVASEITRMIINNYFSGETLDNRKLFSNMTDTIYYNSPISQTEFS